MTVISLLVVIIVSLESVLHYREQWKNIRFTEQLLGHELDDFQTRSGLDKGLVATVAPGASSSASRPRSRRRTRRH